MLTTMGKTFLLFMGINFVMGSTLLPEFSTYLMVLGGLCIGGYVGWMEGDRY